MTFMPQRPDNSKLEAFKFFYPPVKSDMKQFLKTLNRTTIVVQQLFATPWTAACQAYLFFMISWSLLKLMSTELVMPSNHLILHHPLLLPSVFPCIGGFSNESAFHMTILLLGIYTKEPKNRYTKSCTHKNS